MRISTLSPMVLLVSLAACDTTSPEYRSRMEHWAAASGTPRGGPLADAARADAATADAATADLATADLATADLDGALAVAVSRNPRVRAAHQRWRAALERIPQVTSLPDPRLTFSPYLDEVQTRGGAMDWRASLTQGFPWFGTLDLAGQQAVALAEVAREQFILTRLAVEVELGEAWIELLHARADAAIARDHRDLLVQWEPIARQRYAAGVGTHHDLTRAQVELGILEDRLRASEELQRPLRARVNTILDRPTGAPLEPRDELPAPRHVPESAAMLARLEETSPDLRARRLAVEAAELGVSLADLAGYPGFALGVDYTAISAASGPAIKDSGNDAIAVSFGVDLPIFRSRDEAMGHEARANLSAALGDLAAARNRTAAEIEMELFRLGDAIRRVSLYQEELIPLAEVNVNTTLTAYQNDDASFLDLVDAERVWLEFAHAVARARADAGRARYRLRGLSGAELLPEENP